MTVRVRCLVLVGGALLAASLAPPPAEAAGRCITRLPVTVSLPSSFAAAYTKRTFDVRVSTRGPVIRQLKVELYTFGGTRLAVGRRREALRGSGSVRMSLRFAPMQIGRYTLVATGEPNRSRSCGPKKYVRVQRFRSCINRLPIRYALVPGGIAADYGNFLSFRIATEGPLIRDLVASVYSFDGRLFGRERLSALFGEAPLDVELNRPLEPGGYALRVEGRIEQPASCGPKLSDRTVQFG